MKAEKDGEYVYLRNRQSFIAMGFFKDGSLRAVAVSHKNLRSYFIDENARRPSDWPLAQKVSAAELETKLQAALRVVSFA